MRYVLVAALLSCIGIWAAVRRRLRFVTDPGYRGWIDVGTVPGFRLEPMYFVIEYRHFYYFTFSRMHVPRWIGQSYMDEVTDRLYDRFEKELRGGHMYVDCEVPNEVTRGEDDGYTYILEEHRFETFCRTSGVRQQTLTMVMNEYRKAMFREFVADGKMTEAMLR